MLSRQFFLFDAALLALLLTLSSATFAADDGQAFAPCSACHGGQGEGNPALNAPAIAGQDAAYLERQLLNLRAGRRGTHPSDTIGAQMRAIALSLSDTQATQLARYAASLPKTVIATPVRGDLHDGNNLYQGKCSACHGVTAEGNAALKAPRLAGLDAIYIRRQLANFRNAVRGTNPQDLQGRQMAMMAKTLPGERDVDDVIAFIQQQGRTK